MAARKKTPTKAGKSTDEAAVPAIPGQLEMFAAEPEAPVTSDSPASAAEVLLPAAVAPAPVRRRISPEADRKHLTPLEVDRLLVAAKDNPRTGVRDRCLIFLMFRHGLRVTEACAMQMDQVDLESRILQVQRLKGGLSTTQPLRAEEIRLLKSWLQERARWLRRCGRGESRPGMAALDRQALFLSTRGTALSRKTFWALLRRYGEEAGLSLPPHPHMLRHACGFALADQGADTRLIQDYLGHRNIQHTVRYTATNAQRFEKLWR